MASFDYGRVQQAEVLKDEKISPQMNEIHVTVGQVQRPEYRDRCFGILFLLHFVVMISMVFPFATDMIETVDRSDNEETISNYNSSGMEARSFFSSGLRDSFGRAMSYSFGSTCLGSLIVAIIQVIQSILQSSARNERSNGVLRCIAQCLLQYIEQLAEYFNKWAFIYVGLYGYGYVDAGKNVIELFKQRGWTNIITDQLVHRMLGMMCLGIGLVTMLIVTFLGYIGAQDGLSWIAMLSIFVGYYFSATALQVLSSSVDTIIVLYAEAPNEYQENHPELAREMHETWRRAWPENFSGSYTSHETPMEMS